MKFAHAAVLLFALLAALVAQPAIAQTDDELRLAKIVGVWEIAVDETKEAMSEDDLAMMGDRIAEGLLIMTFTKENGFGIETDGRKIPDEMTFTIEDGEEENQYVITVEGAPGPLVINATFPKEDLVKMVPVEGPMPTLVLKRKKDEDSEDEDEDGDEDEGDKVDESVSLEKFTKSLVGTWVSEDESTSAVFNEDGTGAMYRGEEKGPDFTYSVKETEEANTFVVPVQMGDMRAEMTTVVLGEDKISVKPDGPPEAKVFNRKKD